MTEAVARGRPPRPPHDRDPVVGVQREQVGRVVGAGRRVERDRPPVPAAVPHRPDRSQRRAGKSGGAVDERPRMG